MAERRTWNDREKLILLETVLLTLGKPTINGDAVAKLWVGSGNPPSVHMIRKYYRFILRSAEDKFDLKAARGSQSIDKIKKSEDDRPDVKPSAECYTPKTKATVQVSTPASTLASRKKRSGGTASATHKRKRYIETDSEDEAMSISDGPTPSKRVLPRRSARNAVQALSMVTSDDEGVDDAAKDFGGVGSDAEYQNEEDDE